MAKFGDWVGGAAGLVLVAAGPSAANAAEPFAPAGALAGPALAQPFSRDLRPGAPETARWFGGCGWGWGWGGGWCHGAGVGAGGVVAGVLAVGAIAAIATIAANRRARAVNRVPPPPRIDERRTRTGGSGLDRAVGMCVEQVDKGATRSASVDQASRTSDGWRVSGTLRQGGGWNCWIDPEGRIRQIDFGSAAPLPRDAAGADPRADPRADPQWSAQAYGRARANLRAREAEEETGFGAADRAGEDQPAEPEDEHTWIAPASEPSRPLVDTDAPLPAYPGGPLPGEEGYEEAMAARRGASAARAGQ